MGIAIDVEIGELLIDPDEFFHSLCYICLSANVGDPLADALSFKGNVCVRYKDGKGADWLDDLESSAADNASCADYKGILLMMMAVRRTLARQWR